MRRRSAIFKLLVTYIIVLAVGILVGRESIKSAGVPQSLSALQAEGQPWEKNYSATANILAVKSNDNTGTMGSVSVEILPGKGRVLMDTNPFLEPDTQLSAETAVKVAENYTGIDLGDKDVIVSFEMDGEVLGGPSAGAAMAAATIAAIEDRQVRKDVIVTGTIEPSGEIGPIGGIMEKAQAASENGAKLFLVPKHQLKVTYYERQVRKEKIGGFTMQKLYYVPKTLDVANYTTTELGMETKGVSNIGDVVGYMIE
ncbi:hypothetical protein A3K63_02705 [Candidatus Micrarchaeota archaeon RBG_16_49_10]|nr:MAG: hypothetical protein A3K63_02705 [Candidatus Micrarchaeota archaeon RBG_16_49_10]